MFKKIGITISLILLLLNIGFTQTGETLFNKDKVHVIEFTFQESNFWNILTQNYNNSIDWITQVPSNVPYLMGEMSLNGVVVDSIGVRQKGFSSHFSSNEHKKSLKLKMNEFVSGQKLEGLKKINLLNGVGDPAMQRDVLCYDLMRKQGVNVPRTSYAEVYMNGTYWGLYLLVEQIDKTFVADNFINGTGNLYKNIGWSDLDWKGTDPASYTDAIELKTNETVNDWSGFINLLDVINNTSSNEFQTEIKKVFDVDYYLRALAVDVITDNWDSYIDHGRDYYLYQEPISELFYWIPWDYNLSMGGNFEGDSSGGTTEPADCPTIITGSCPYLPTDTVFQEVIAADDFCCSTDWDNTCQQAYDDIVLNGSSEGGGSSSDFPLIIDNPDKVLMTKILEVADFKEKYLNYCCEIMENDFTQNTMFPLVDLYGGLIDSSIVEDSNYNFNYSDFTYDISDGDGSMIITSIKEFITNRIPSVEASFTNLNFDCSDEFARINWNDVVINEFMTQNDSIGGSVMDNDSEYDDWIELYNNSNQIVDLTYYYLSDENGNKVKWSFPYGTSIAANSYLIVWADGQAQQVGLHSNFRLNSGGEQLFLSHLDGTVIDSVNFDGQWVNTTMARIPNGTGSFERTLETFNASNLLLSIHESNDFEYAVYPNPASDIVVVNYSANGSNDKVDMSLINMNGQVVMNYSTTDYSGNYTFDISGLSKGLYLLQLRSDNLINDHHRIVIQ